MNERGMPTPPSEFASRLLPDPALEHAPDQVVKTHKAAAEALDRHRKLVTAEREAIVAARNADAVDQKAVKAALDAGRQAPKLTAPAKKEAAEKATRTLEASVALVEEKFAALADVVRTHHREWTNALLPTLEATTTRAQAAVARTREEFAGFDMTASVLTYLRGFDPDRPKMMELREARLVTPGEEVERTPSALLAALGEVAGEYQAALSEGETTIERQAAETARNVARRAIRHQQREERKRHKKTTTWVT